MVVVTHIGRQAILNTVLGTGVSDLGLDGMDHCPIINTLNVNTYVHVAVVCFSNPSACWIYFFLTLVPVGFNFF